jgi:hypothetical protein
MGIGAVSPRVKWQKLEADHRPSSIAEAKNGVAIPSLPHTPSCHGACYLNTGEN